MHNDDAVDNDISVYFRFQYLDYSDKLKIICIVWSLIISYISLGVGAAYPDACTPISLSTLLIIDACITSLANLLTTLALVYYIHNITMGLIRATYTLIMSIFMIIVLNYTQCVHVGVNCMVIIKVVYDICLAAVLLI